VAPLRQGEGVNGVRQVRQYSFEGAPGVSDGMQKYHGNARGVSLLHIGKLYLVGKLNRCDNRCHVYLSRPRPPFSARVCLAMPMIPDSLAEASNG
jgi:hypothetical protein